MTTHEKALRAAMNAYEETGIAADRLPNAIAAYLSALLSDDALDLVAEMTSEDFRHEMQHLRSSSEIDRLFQAAASLIQSQAARIAELEAENEHCKEIGSLAVKFRFSDDIFVESRGHGVWVVTNGSSVLNNLGEWEYEPRPSSRTDEFIDRTRLAFSDAVMAARSLLNKDASHD